jgi:hypothetical protein
MLFVLSDDAHRLAFDVARGAHLAFKMRGGEIGPRRRRGVEALVTPARNVPVKREMVDEPVVSGSS